MKTGIGVFIVLLLGTIPAALCAAPTFVLNEGFRNHSMGLHLDIVEDKDHRWSINEVIQSDIAQQFVPVEVQLES